MNAYNFSEALSWMKAGMSVKSPSGKIYKIENEQLIYYPDPIKRPKHRCIESRMSSADILSNDWMLL